MATPSTGVPELDEQLGPVYALPLPPPIDRRDFPSNEVELLTVPLSDAEWLIRMGLPPATGPAPTALPTRLQGPIVMVPGTGTRKDPDELILHEPEESMIHEDIWDWVDDNLPGVLRGTLPGGVPWGGAPPLSNQPVIINPGNGGGGGGGGFYPPVPVGGNACSPDDPMKGMVMKKVCGEYRWVKQKRRRRKKLATKSDLAGLASLKGILGTGKAFEVWIATHS